MFRLLKHDVLLFEAQAVGGATPTTESPVLTGGTATRPRAAGATGNGSRPYDDGRRMTQPIARYNRILLRARRS